MTLNKGDNVLVGKHTWTQPAPHGKPTWGRINSLKAPLIASHFAIAPGTDLGRTLRAKLLAAFLSPSATCSGPPSGTGFPPLGSAFSFFDPLLTRVLFSDGGLAIVEEHEDELALRGLVLETEGLTDFFSSAFFANGGSASMGASGCGGSGRGCCSANGGSASMAATGATSCSGDFFLPPFDAARFALLAVGSPSPLLSGSGSAKGVSDAFPLDLALAFAFPFPFPFPLALALAFAFALPAGLPSPFPVSLLAPSSSSMPRFNASWSRRRTTCVGNKWSGTVGTWWRNLVLWYLS